MIMSVINILDKRFLSEASYEKLDVIDSCYDAVDEGVNDLRVIDTANTYTYSLIIEILDNVKEQLLKLCEMVLSAVNKFILRSGKMLDKYRELLEDRVSKLKQPFVYKYFEYPESKDYPKVLSTSSGIEKDIQDMQKAIVQYNWTSEKVYNAVDLMLSDFAEKTIGEAIDLDATGLRADVSNVVTNKIRGSEITKRLKHEDIDKFISEIRMYKPHVDDIKRTKKNILADYELLKKTYSRAIKTPENIRTLDRIQAIHDPDGYAFEMQERVRYSDINVQMMRLFNGFITIYDAAFNTKLKCLQERIDINMGIITELMTVTNLGPLLNTKDPTVAGKPYQYGVKIRT